MASTAKAPGRPCKGISKASGQACKGFCLPGSDYCIAHDPNSGALRAKARRAGGKARHGRKIGTTGITEALIELHTVGDVLSVLQRVINDAFSMEKSLARSRTIGSLCTVAIKAIEVGEHEQRLAAIEAQLAVLRSDDIRMQAVAELSRRQQPNGIVRQKTA